MPRPKKLDVIKILEKSAQYADIILSQGIHASACEVWGKLERDLQFCHSKKYLYLIFKENRHNVQQLLKGGSIESEEFEGLQTTDNCSRISASSEDDASTDEHGAVSVMQFVITLAHEEWQKISPKEVVYKSTDRSNPGRLTRRYEVLPPESGWTAIINDHIWAHTKLSCCLTFKRCKIHRNSGSFLRMTGSCSKCGSIFEGEMVDEPLDTNRALINCTYKGNFQNCNCRKKRRILKSQRDDILKHLVDFRESPSLYRGNIINETLQLNEFEPSHIPNLNTLRLIKSRFRKNEALHPDPIAAIAIMKYCDPFQGFIKDIGYDPFYVHYWGNSQIAVYSSYAESISNPTVIIDATGGVVKKISRPFKNTSRVIFLYTVCVYDSTKKLQYPICNMLSERHNTIAISNFFNNYFNGKLPAPKTVICDHSTALLAAAVRALTQFSSLEAYLCNSSLILTEPEKILKPTCFIRCDVAHTVKIIAGWIPLKTVTKRIRQFYIRSVCNIVKSKNIEEVRSLLNSIFIVASSPDGGVDNLTGRKMLCEEEKERLKVINATGVFAEEYEENVIPSLIEDVLSGNEISSEHVDSPEEILPQSQVSRPAIGSPFKMWAEEIYNKVKEKISSQQSDEDNGLYLPKLIPCILDFMKYLPLWSAVLVPIFQYGDTTVSSAPVESLFNDLKTRTLGHVQLPLPADVFLMHHIPRIEGILKSGTARNRTVNPNSNEDQIDSHNLESEHTDQRETINVSQFQTQKPKQHEPDTVSVSQCLACARGDRPTGAHKCSLCGKAVHIIFLECSVPSTDSEEGYGERRICRQCYTNQECEASVGQIVQGETENRVHESRAKQVTEEQRQTAVIAENECEENWKGQTSTKTRPQKSVSYLIPNPDIRNIDLESKAKASPIGILKNGCRTNDLKPVRIGKKRYVVDNTCAFDSIVQIVASSYSDSEHFKNFVDLQKENSLLWKITTNMDRLGVTAWLYKWRTKLLSSLCEKEDLLQGITKINAAAVSTVMCEKLMKLYPSATECITCSEGICTKSYNHIVCKVLLTNSDIKNLSKLVSNLLNDRTEICSVSGATHKIAFEISENMFIVDLQKQYEFNESHAYDLSDPVIIRLNDIPDKLNVKNTSYNLRGVVCLLGSGIKGNVNILGHYVSYCRRIDNSWELYNDLSNSKKYCSAVTEVGCELIIYTK